MNKLKLITVFSFLCIISLSCKGQSDKTISTETSSSILQDFETIQIGDKFFKFKIGQDKKQKYLTNDAGKHYPEILNFYSDDLEEDSPKLVSTYNLPFDLTNESYSNSKLKQWFVGFPSIENDLDITSFPGSSAKAVLITDTDPNYGRGKINYELIFPNENGEIKNVPILSATQACLILFSDDTNSLLHFEAYWNRDQEEGRFDPHHFKVYKYDYIEEDNSFNKTFLGTTKNKFSSDGASKSKMFFDMVKNEEFLHKVPYGTYLSNNF